MVDPRIRRAARLELARRDFWSFCKLMAPDFYREDRPYLKTLYQYLTLQICISKDKLFCQERQDQSSENHQKDASRMRHRKV